VKEGGEVKDYGRHPGDAKASPEKKRKIES